MSTVWGVGGKPSLKELRNRENEEKREEKNKLDMEEYLVEMDFRLAMIEIGGEENDL